MDRHQQLALVQHIAARRGLVDNEAVERVRQTLSRFSLPDKFNYTGDIETIISALSRDKKSVRGRTRFVLPSRIGEVSAGHEVEDDEVKAALAELMA